MQFFQSLRTANLPDSQTFQSFPTKVAQNQSEWPIFVNLQVFQSFPTKAAQNHLEQPILPDVQLFQSFPIEVANFLSFFNFFKLFDTEAAHNDLQW